MRRFEQDSGDRLDYVVDWTKQLTLDGDTISQSQFDVPTGIVQDGTGLSSTTARVWLKSGVGGVHKITNTITTVGGRVYSRSIEVSIREL